MAGRVPDCFAEGRAAFLRCLFRLLPNIQGHFGVMLIIFVCLMVQFSGVWWKVPERGLATTSNRSTNDTPGLLLSVPFYVYEELAWVNATLCNSLVTPRGSSSHKHSDDYWFLAASLQHPMRTHDPSEARLFVVGMLLNHYDRRNHFVKVGQECSLCWNDMCDNQLLMYAGRILNASKWFHRYPERHIVVQSHYMGVQKKWFNVSEKPTFLYDMLYLMNAIAFEKPMRGNRPINSPSLLNAPSYYVGTPCELSEEKRYDVAFVGTLHDEKPLFQERRDLCRWLTDNTTNTTYRVKIPFCGTGKQCPTLAQAKFGFHVRGDTFGSNRLMDTLLSGTVPIFTSTEQESIQGTWIDWAKLSYHISLNDTSKADFLDRLSKILEDDEGYKRRYRAVLENRQLFNWTSLYPFDTYMYMLQAELYPETQQLKSRWSALILPLTSPK